MSNLLQKTSETKKRTIVGNIIMAPYSIALLLKSLLNNMEFCSTSDVQSQNQRQF